MSMFLEWEHIHLQGHWSAISLTFVPHFPLTYLGTARLERSHPSQWLTLSHLHRLSEGDTLTGLRKELAWAHLGSHCPDELSILPHSFFPFALVVRCHGQSKQLAHATQLLFVSPGFNQHGTPSVDTQSSQHRSTFPFNDRSRERDQGPKQCFSLGGQMTFSKGSSKIIGKHRYLHNDS